MAGKTGFVVGAILNYDELMKGFFALLMVVSLPLIAADNGYRIVHPDGTVEFTDDDTKGGEAIPLKEVPSYQLDAITNGGAPSVTNGNSGQQSADDQSSEGGEVNYESITIVSPNQEETVWFDAAGFTVNVRVAPKLAEGHQVVIYLDGTEAARGETTSLTIPRVVRGTHTLTAVVQDNSGETLLSSSAITFYMRQHSIQ